MGTRDMRMNCSDTAKKKNKIKYTTSITCKCELGARTREKNGKTPATVAVEGERVLGPAQKDRRRSPTMFYSRDDVHGNHEIAKLRRRFRRTDLCLFHAQVVAGEKF